MNHHGLAPTPEMLMDMVGHQRIGAEYQPIKEALSLHTTGHEALARFYSPNGQALPPQIVFDTLHDDPAMLIEVELMSKRWQIANAPQDGWLFLNLDPHALGKIDDPARHPLLALLTEPARTVIELIENTTIQEADLSMALMQLLAGRGIRTALDDIGAPGSMIAFPILSAVDIYKFDRHWLRLAQQPRERRLLEMLLSFARSEGKQTVLEGIETTEDLQLARELGLDYVQGYLFRSEFIHCRA